MAPVGDARVGTEEQATARRLDGLRAAGCAEAHEGAEHRSAPPPAPTATGPRWPDLSALAPNLTT
jgi:hypothetical protein